MATTHQHHSRPDPPADPAASMDLLRTVMTDTIDPDYAVVAAKRERPAGPRPWSGWLTVVSLGLVGLMAAAAAVYDRDTEPQQLAERAALVQEVRQQRAELSRQQDRINELQDEVSGLQGNVDTTAARGEELVDSLRTSRILAGATPVQGPGVRIVVNDAPGSEPGGEGRVRDTDLQLLANGLWQSGAEAISLNGQRISPLSAIDTAGDAITVNYASLRPPYTVHAIGNPETLEATFVDTAAGQTWLDLETNFNLAFEMTTRDEINMFAAPGVDVTYSERQGELP